MPIIKNNNSGVKKIKDSALIMRFVRADVLIRLTTGDQKFKNSGIICSRANRMGLLAINSYAFGGASFGIKFLIFTDLVGRPFFTFQISALFHG